MKKKILVVLNGGGDTFVKLVNFEAEEWFYSPIPASGEEVIPADVLFGHEDAVDDDDLLVTVSSGSPDNDRAIACPGDDMGSLSAAIQYAKTNKIDIAGEYHGYLY